MSSIRSYYRQNEALEEAVASSKLTFSHEIDFGGKRKFLTSSLDDFWSLYLSKSEKNRKFYEVIPSQSHSKLYYDLEYPVEENELKDGRKMLDILIEETIMMLDEMFGHRVLKDDILILEATTPLKYSLHVIFTKTVFDNNLSIGCFVKVLKSKLQERHSGLFDVQNKGKTVSFIDSCVYKKHQNFRLFLSRKMGKENYLLLSSIRNDSWKLASNEDIFRASIITNVDRDAGDAVLKMKEHAPVQGPKTFIMTSPVTDKYKYKSPYHEIEEILLKKVSPGYIRDCIYFGGLSEVVIFSIGGSRWCSNVGREHSSNNIFYICNLGDMTLVQACHRCNGFRGEKLQLDTRILSWIDEDM